jgi:hypothetical protein
MKSKRLLNTLLVFVAAVFIFSPSLYSQGTLEPLRLEEQEITEKIISAKAQTMLGCKENTGLSESKDIIFSRGGFGHVRRTGHPYTGILFMGNASKDRVLTVKSLTVSSGTHPKAYLKSSAHVEESIKTMVTVPFTVKTDAFEKPLYPLGKKLEELEEVAEQIKGFESRITQETENISALHEDENYMELLVKGEALEVELENFLSTTTITIDLSYFPELEVIGNKIKIELMIELEDEEGIKTTAYEILTLERHPPLPTPEGWYAGDPHTHTIWSDGNLNVYDLGNNAVCQDLDWVVITDHSHMVGFSGWTGLHKDNIYDYVMNIELISNAIENLSLIGGIELGSCNITPSWSKGHYLVYPDDILAYWNCTIPSDSTGWPRYIEDIMLEAEKIGAFGYIAHPNASPLFGWTGNFSGYNTLSGIEIINGGSYYNYDSVAWAYVTWWDELKKGNRIFGHAATDIHYKSGEHVKEIGELVTYVKTPPLNNSSILDAYKKGQSSFGLGAWLDIQVSFGDAKREMGEILYLPASGTPQVDILTSGKNYNPVASQYGELTEIRFQEITDTDIWRFGTYNTSGMSEWNNVQYSNREVKSSTLAYLIIGADANNKRIAFTNPVFIERSGHRMEIRSTPSGVNITADTDLNGLFGRATPFYGVYSGSVELKAPSTYGGQNFEKWLKNGNHESWEQTITVSAGNDIYTAVYETEPTEKYKFDDAIFCRDIESTSPYDYITPISSYNLFQDSRVRLWIKLLDIYMNEDYNPLVQARARFYRPNGSLHAEISDATGADWTVSDPRNDGVTCRPGWVFWSNTSTIPNYNMSDYPGRWTCIIEVNAEGSWVTAKELYLDVADIRPKNVSASQGSFTDRVEITWDSVSSATHYRVYRSTSNNSSTAAELETLWQTERTYNDYNATPEQTYYYWVKAATSSAGARASGFSSSDSGWRALPDCVISTPDIPTGPDSGITGKSYTYTTGGSTCSNGHSVQYRFNWDDGTYSDWSSSTETSKSWAAAGTYQVTAQARCSIHTHYLSAESPVHEVIIRDEPTAWTATLQATLDGSVFVDTMLFGMQQEATNNYDAGIDQLAPPAAPAPDDNDVFFSSITNQSGYERLWKDYRGISEDTTIWRLGMEVNNNRTMLVSWDNLPAQPSMFTIQEADNSWNPIAGTARSMRSGLQFVEINNTTGSRLSKKYLIIASTDICFDISLIGGTWNLVSLPVEPQDTSPQNLFGAGVTIYQWNAQEKRYIIPATLQAKVGYWVRVSADITVTVCGTPPANTLIPVFIGWNLVGCAEDMAVPAGYTVYGWDPLGRRYIILGTLTKGCGNWIYSPHDGNI